MIKVIVVDDDKLVRKGLISVMPWGKFNMQIVGEADSGKSALELLKDNKIDLMLTDLTMPLLSGIELMKITRVKYPKLFTVVLTFHEDFEYIQEALRLGAIDYIAKIQLEKESMEDVLSRIYKRILEEQKNEIIVKVKEKNYDNLSYNTLYVMISDNDNNDITWLVNDMSLRGMSIYEIDNRMWVYVPIDELDNINGYAYLEKKFSNFNHWTLIKLVGIQEENIGSISHILKKYIKRNFFYDFDKNNNKLFKSINELVFETKEVNELISKRRKNLLSFKWVNDDLLFGEILKDLRISRLSVEKVIHLLYETSGEWNIIYYPFTLYKIELPEIFNCWYELENWFKSTQASMKKSIRKQSYSNEVTYSIMKAVKIVHEEINQEVYAVDVTKRVNMSRSYFSICFKDIVGKSFNDYLRFIRVEKAKELLLQTNKPIQWISELTGYMDQKYFSQVFHEQTGMLPSEYRKSSTNGLNKVGQMHC